MQKDNLRIPTGLLVALAIGVLGFRDTGIFVNSFNAKLNNGVEINQVPNDRADIIREGDSGTTYLVESKGVEFYVPKKSILKVDSGVEGYTVAVNTAIKNADDGSIMRLLSVGEYLEYINDLGNQALVKTEDGLMGLVEKDRLAPDRIRHIEKGFIKEDITVGGRRFSKGESVDIAWFQEDYFIVVDGDFNKFNVPKNNISLVDLEREAQRPEDRMTASLALGDIDKRDGGSSEREFEHNSDDRFERNVPNGNFENPVIDDIVRDAYNLLGSTYVYGDEGEKGFDCSGMVYYLYNKYAGLKLPRSSKDMSEYGMMIESVDDLIPGDLLFFDSSSSTTISHVGLYVGDGLMIHASYSKGQVVMDEINGYYVTNNFVHGRRVLN